MKKTAAPVVEAALEKIAEPSVPVVAGEASDLNAWGQAQLTTKDIIIPRILLMQPMSDKVTAGEAAFGEFRESLNNELLGKFEEGFEVVPFHMEKVFVEYDASNPKKKEFLRITPITPANENLKYEDTEVTPEGKKLLVSRDRAMNFYVLLPQEIEVGGAIPYIISARRTSLNAGKKLATQMYMKNLAAGKNPAAVICKITAKKETNDEGTYGVLDVTPSKATPTEYVAEAFKWLQLIKSGKAKVDEQAFNEEPSAQAPRSVGNVDSGPAKF